MPGDFGFTVLLPQPAQARHGAQFQRPGLLLVSYGDGPVEPDLNNPAITLAKRIG